MINTINTAVCYLWELLKEYILKGFITRKKFFFYFFNFASIWDNGCSFHDECKPKHYAVCLKHIQCCMPWVGKIPWRRKWQPTPVFLPGESSWTEEPGGLQSMGLQRSGHYWAAEHEHDVCDISIKLEETRIMTVVQWNIKNTVKSTHL